nr:reverse transcriptase domain-containing protein [Tanacetum cinerariifolium]
MFKQLHLNITLAEALVLMPKYQKMLKALLFNKEKLQELANTPLNENCSAVILKKLPEKLRDPGKFLISEDCLEDLVLNKQSGNPTFSLHKEIASLEVTHELHDSEGCTFLSEELPDIDSFNDIHPHFDDDPLSEDSDLKDSIDQTDLANLADLFVDPTPKMFTDEHAPDYSLPSRFDVYPGDFLEIEFDADNFDDDSFDSKGEGNQRG